MCSIRVSDEKTRDKLRKYLLDFKIDTRPGFDSSHTLPHLKSDEIFSVAENLSKTVINLPSWPDLSNKDLDFIIGKIKLFIMKRKLKITFLGGARRVTLLEK